MDLQSIFRDVCAPLFAALALGGVVGLERMRKDRPAGFRTYSMVSVGSAAFVLMAMRVFEQSGQAEAYGADPTRMIHGIATGIGFLGAGSIMRGGGDVRGVTTAAGIWAAGALGAACGLRYYDLAVVLTVVMLLILYPLELLEEWMEKRTDIKG